ncbi:hypothetical protein P8452_55797 [Trifolium repens]|nr:hypothetical protein P8452_11972 [Trifolium repens]WJX48923.1 hypothetical protein P8452_35420 [Trifolium repens]WJX71851.1 hypothetical protein P8452_55797 [Trifolium repens]
MSFPPWILFPEILEQVNKQIDVDRSADSIEDTYMQDEDPKDINSWEVVVSRSTYIWSNALYVPTEIAKNCLKDNQNVVTLIDVNSDKLYPCQICYYKSHGSKLTYIEQGFKEFFREAELNVGDKLHLTVSVPPDFIDVAIMRHDVARL